MRSNLQPVQIPLLKKQAKQESNSSRFCFFQIQNLEESRKFQNVEMIKMYLIHRTHSSNSIVKLAWGIHGLEEPKISESPKSSSKSFRSAKLAPKENQCDALVTYWKYSKKTRHQRIETPEVLSKALEIVSSDRDAPNVFQWICLSASPQGGNSSTQRPGNIETHTEAFRKNICKFC